MVDLAVLTMVKDVVTILGVIGGFTYYVMNVRASQRNQKHQRETREAQFLLELNRIWTKELTNDWYEVSKLPFQDTQDFFEKYDNSENSETRLQRGLVFNDMNIYGHILMKGFIDSVTMYDAFSGSSVIRMWNKYESVIKRFRVRGNNPFYLDGFEYLAGELKKVEKNKLQSIS